MANTASWRWGTRTTFAPGEGSRRLGLLGIAVALYVLFSITYSHFDTFSNGKTILLNVSSIAIAGIGSTWLLISGNVDLSIGSMWAFDGMVTGWVASNTHNALLAVLAGLALGCAMGLINGVLVATMKISPLIVTLAMFLFWGGAAYVITAGEPLFGFSSAFVSIGTSTLLGVPTPVIVAAVLVIALGWYLRSSIYGLRLYAIGGGMETARLNGVRTRRTLVSLYAINGVLVGVVAILSTAQLSNASPEVGTTFNLDVLTAVILGGVAFNGGSGRSLGALIGVLTIGVLTAGLVFAGWADWYQQMVRGGVLLVALGADQAISNQRSSGRQRLPLRRSRGTSDSDGEDPPETTVTETVLPALPTGEMPAESVLACRGISRSYGAVSALSGVNMSVRAGEIVCLVGDNGAGKSTLVKLIAGAIAPSEGEILLDGLPLDTANPDRVHRAGVQTVFQDLALCPNLSVTHNLVLGDEPRHRWLGWAGIRDDRVGEARAIERLERFGVHLPDTRMLVKLLSGGQRQSVAIARALKDGTRLVILDEPTAALGVGPTARVLAMIRSVAKSGAAVLVVSHDIQTVFDVADRVVVLRQGSLVLDVPIAEVTEERLVRLMAGLKDTGAAQAEGLSYAR